MSNNDDKKNESSPKTWHMFMSANGPVSIEIGKSDSELRHQEGDQSPEDVSAELDADAIQEVIDFIESISGITLTAVQATNLLSPDGKLRHEIMEWGVDDTETGGAIANALARDLIDRDWPTYAETDDSMSFVGLLRVAAAGRGYALVKPLDDDEGGIPTIVKQT